MAYKTKDLEKKAIKEITKDKNIWFLYEVAYAINIAPQTFYNHNLDKLDSIKNALEANKIHTKRIIRNKLLINDSPAAQISLYKLAGTEDEYYRLSNAQQKITTEQSHEIIIKDGTEFGIP